MASFGLRVTFPYEPGTDYDFYERIAFWDSPETIEWFKNHGYTLYRRSEYAGEESVTFPVFPSDATNDFVEANYPYAHHDLRTPDPDEGYERDPPLLAQESTGKIASAQDSLKRHVAIKLVRDDTGEYRVLRFLSQQSMDVLKANCIIPVLDLLPIEGFWFAVMPRWGTVINQPAPKTLSETVDIIHSWLKGLNYLHEHNISHGAGDIREDNILVNHFGDIQFMSRPGGRAELRSKKCLSYALFDFDFAVMLAPDEDRTKFRLPYQRSWGSFNASHDTAAGEYEYSPFILDVGTCGVELCEIHQHITPYLPFLAPLLDRMTTWDLRRRFTASEALQFFEQSISEMSQKELETPHPTMLRPDATYFNYDRWAGLPLDLKEKWKTHKTPPIPWHLMFLRVVNCRLHRFPHFIPQTRRFFAGLTSLVHRLYKVLFRGVIHV